MKENSDTDLIRLAETICDGARVDWDKLQTERPDQKPILDAMRLLETMMTARESAGGDVESPPANRRWGHLHLLEKIGEGGFGEVFRAFDPTLEREVALKLLRSERSPTGANAERYVGEARQLARVRHPNVLVVHGADRHDGRLGLWTDFVSGRTLEEWIDQHGCLGMREAAGIGVDLCRALAAVHAAGLAHRDVKTTNIMREDGGRILLMDFGSVADGSSPPGSKVPALFEVGTPLTMAPEQLRGEPARPGTDIYALGVLLYRLVTGRFPVEATDLKELVGKHERGEATPLGDLRPDLPGEFVRIVERALDPNPARRFSSAGAMERALLGLEAGATDENGRTPFGIGARKAWLAVAVVLGAIAWIALARFHSSTGSASDPDPTMTRASVKSSAPDPVPTAALPTPLHANATLMRDRNGRIARLATGDRVAPGDAMFLEFEGAEPAHVYVLDEDGRGNAFVLFPVPDVDLHNPLPPGVVHRLPGAHGGNAIDWQVSSSGGRETIHVVASRQPLMALERELSQVPRAAARGATTESESIARGTRRGIGRLTQAPIASGQDAAGFSRLIRTMLADSSTARDAWLWKIELENPGR